MKPVQTTILTVDVAKATGAITHLMKPTTDIRTLSDMSESPTAMPGTADLKFRWFCDSCKATYIWQIIELNPARVCWSYSMLLSERTLEELEKTLAEQYNLRMSTLLTYELKLELGIVPQGTEPREFPSLKALPSRAAIASELKKASSEPAELTKQLQLKWLEDNYEKIVLALQTFDKP